MLSEKEIKAKRKTLNDIDKTVVVTFKVLSDVNRYRIFRLIADQNLLSISDIAKILGISLPLASQHLKILVHAGLLQKERDGKHIYPKLEISKPLVKTIVKTIQQIK